MSEVDKIYKIIDELYPKSLSDRYCEKFGAYDNSGIIIDCSKSERKNINKILFSLDFSLSAVKYASENGFDLIVTHHPAIFYPIKNICDERYVRAIKNGISVISMHLNFDVHSHGIDYFLAKVLGAEEKMEIVDSIGENEGYGKRFAVNKIEMNELLNKVNKTLGTDKTILYANGKKHVESIASFCGAGGDEKIVDKVCCDLIVTSDLKHHIITDLLDKGFAVMNLTHYSAENYGFNQIYKTLKGVMKVETDYFSDFRLL